MAELVRRTWLPTLLFALPMLAIEWAQLGVTTAPIGTYTIMTVIVIPPIWWRTAAARGWVGAGRGAAVGALCGAVLVVLPVSYIAVLFLVSAIATGKHQLGMAFAITAVTYLIGFVVSTIAGAGIGALAGLLQRRMPRTAPGPKGGQPS